MNDHTIRAEAIVKTALDLAEEHGIAGVTTAALASHLEFTEAALYRYFPGKGAIIATGLQHLGERLFATMMLELMPEAVGHGHSVELQVRRHTQRFLLRQGLLLELLVCAAGGRDSDLQDAGDVFLQGYADRMRTYFSELQRLALTTAAISADELSRLWICQLLGGFVRCRLTRESWDPEAQPGFEAFLNQLRRSSHAPAD